MLDITILDAVRDGLGQPAANTKWALESKMKCDVLIPTKDPKKIRPKLLEVLESSPYVKDIIIETSRPLSKARKVGALKCSTEWIAMFDDDVEIPPNWFEIVCMHAKQDVVAVSSVFQEKDIHFAAFFKASELFKPQDAKDTPYMCNALIRRSIFEDFNPPALSQGEDLLIYKHAKTKGRWVNLKNIGVVHFYSPKPFDTRGGEILHYTKYCSSFAMAKDFALNFLLPFFAVPYSRRISTISFFFKMNVYKIAGVMKACAS